MTTQVRTATAGDVAALEGLLLAMFEGSQFAGEDRYSEARARGTLASLMASPTSRVFVLVNDDDVPVGIMLGILVPSWWQRGDEAMDLGLFVLPNYRGHGVKLIYAYRAWARSYDSVLKIYLNVSFGGKEGADSERVMQRLGMQRQGGFYFQRVKR